MENGEKMGANEIRKSPVLVLLKLQERFSHMTTEELNTAQGLNSDILDSSWNVRSDEALLRPDL